jgi:hypothetical protein
MHIMLSLCAAPIDTPVISASPVGDLALGGFMYTTRMIIALLFCVAEPVLAQSSSSSLNLQLPSSATSQQTSAISEPKPAPEPSATTDTGSSNTANLPAPYDTTYGDRRDAVENACDDKTYSKPQVHGSVGIGVAASKRASANSETTELDVSKPLGSCDDPKGNISASIRVTKSNVNFGRRNGP